MANPLYNAMGNQSNPMADIIRQAKDFKKSFTGNPRDEVQRLLNSGQMSQQQFNQLSQIAQQVVQAMGEDI
ncbi:MAG: hypothetical protein IKY67_05730 [Paludibacteraceae bacterium]|nr:hypothetical protein [Paludibacteraceae bacterium]